MKSSSVRTCAPLAAEGPSLDAKHPLGGGKGVPCKGAAEAAIDKTLVNHRFSRVVESYHREAVAQRQIAGRLVDLLQRASVPIPSRPHVLEIGCGTGFLTRPLVGLLQPDCLVLNDLCAEMRRCYDDWLSESSGSPLQGTPGEVHFLAGDAETLLFPGGQDLIVSCSVLQWFTAPEVFFSRCARLLKPDGCLAFSTFGSDNLKEVTALTGAGLTYRSLEEWKTLLAPHFDVLYAGEERIGLTFDTPLDVLYHLKHTGVTAVRREAWTPGDLRRFCSRYTATFGTAGDVASGHPAARKHAASDGSVASGHPAARKHAASDGSVVPGHPVASGRPSGVPLTYHPLYFLARPRPSVR